MKDEFQVSNNSKFDQKQQQTYKQLTIKPGDDITFSQDIVNYLKKKNPLMKSDAKEICQMVKNSHSAMLNLLNSVSTSIDPSFSIQSFQDEKFVTFIRKMGYPVYLSKTKLNSLGTGHNYVTTLHLIRWLCQFGERFDEVFQEQSLFSSDDGFEQLILAAYFRPREEGYFQEQLQSIEDKLLEEKKKLSDQKQTILAALDQERQRQPKFDSINQEIEKVDDQIHLQETKIQQMEKELQALDREENNLIQNINQKQYEIQELNIYSSQLQQQIDTQKLDIYQANDLRQKTQTNSNKIQSYVEEIAKLDDRLNQQMQMNQQLIKENDGLILNINNYMTVSGPLEIREKLKDLTLPTKYNLFDDIPLDVQLRDNGKGQLLAKINKNRVESFYEEDVDNLLILDQNPSELECFQKIVEDKNLRSSLREDKRRKSVQVYDILLKRDEKRMADTMIPTQLKQKIKSAFQEIEQLNKKKLQEVEQTLKSGQEKYEQLKAQEIQLNASNQDLQIQIDELEKRSFDQQQFYQVHQQLRDEQKLLEEQKRRIINQIKTFDIEIPKLKEEASQLEHLQDSLNEQIIEKELLLEKVQTENDELFNSFRKEVLQEIQDLQRWVNDQNQKFLNF